MRHVNFAGHDATPAIRHVAALTVLFVAATWSNGCAAVLGRVTPDGLPRLRLLHRSDLLGACGLSRLSQGDAELNLWENFETAVRLNEEAGINFEAAPRQNRSAGICGAAEAIAYVYKMSIVEKCPPLLIPKIKKIHEIIARCYEAPPPPPPTIMPPQSPTCRHTTDNRDGERSVMGLLPSPWQNRTLGISKTLTA